MTPQYNLRTIHHFEVREGKRVDLDSPGRYIRIVADRLVYLTKKQAELEAQLNTKVKGPSYFEDERHAYCWMLAHYAQSTGQDVRTRLAKREMETPLGLDLYDKIAASLAEKQKIEAIEKAKRALLFTPPIAEAA